MNDTDMHHRARFTICVVTGNFRKWSLITEFTGNHFAFQRVHGIGHDVYW